MAEATRRLPSVMFIGGAAYAGHGGIQRFNRRVISALDRLGMAATVLMLHDRADGNPAVQGYRGSMLRFLHALVCRSRSADLLLVGHINFLPLAALYRAINPSGRVILFAHGIEVWNDPRYRRARVYEPLLLARVIDKIAIVSRFSQDVMSREFRLADDRFVLFPNAMDIGAAAMAERSARSYNVLAVSRLGAGELEKHVDKVIHAMPGVVAELPQARLTIVGDGELKPALVELAKKLGVADRVSFLGFVDDAALDAAYQSASVFALPSSKEGFGIVYLEAWARGLPVIASKFGAGGEVVTDGLDGFTVDPHNVEELASRIRLLLEDQQLAKRFAAAGQEKVRGRYSAPAFEQRLGALCT